jgi:hypothetical protein
MQYSAGTVAAEDNDAGGIIDKKFENRQEFLDIIKKIVFVYPKLNEYKIFKKRGSQKNFHTVIIAILSFPALS